MVLDDVLTLQIRKTKTELDELLTSEEMWWSLRAKVRGFRRAKKTLFSFKGISKEKEKLLKPNH